jgi:hypothetical protein
MPSLIRLVDVMHQLCWRVGTHIFEMHFRPLFP